MAMQINKIDFCQKNRLLKNHLYLRRYKIFFQLANDEMLSTYPTNAICFCLWTFFKMAGMSKMALSVNVHVFFGFSRVSHLLASWFLVWLINIFFDYLKKLLGFFEHLNIRLPYNFFAQNKLIFKFLELNEQSLPFSVWLSNFCC
jgi:hypothetical protein